MNTEHKNGEELREYYQKLSLVDLILTGSIRSRYFKGARRHRSVESQNSQLLKYSIYLQEFCHGLGDLFILDKPVASFEEESLHESTACKFFFDVYSSINPLAKFRCKFFLKNGMDWDSWSTQPFPTGFIDNEEEIDIEYLDWTYYEMDIEKCVLKGLGELKGSEITFEPFIPDDIDSINERTAFQLGMNANFDFGQIGILGEFIYSGMVSYNSSKVQVYGFGELNLSISNPFEELEMLQKNVESEVLLDTGVFISGYFKKGNKKDSKFWSWLVENTKTMAISALTYYECLQGVTDKEELIFREVLLSHFEIIPIDNKSLEAANEIRAGISKGERKNMAVDILIAGCAKSRGLQIIHLNPKDFDKMEGVDCINILRQ